jgi:hypothetical protein
LFSLKVLRGGFAGGCPDVTGLMFSMFAADTLYTQGFQAFRERHHHRRSRS